jgi:uncharacterized protein
VIEWDREKNRANIAKHGIPLGASTALFAGPVLEEIDTSIDYAEERILATGLLKGRVYVCVYTWRLNDVGAPIRRIISLRRATRKEADDYYKEFAGRR